MVSFLLFIAPAIRKAMGQTANLLPPIVKTRIDASLKSRGDRRNYLRVRVVARDGELVSVPMSSQGSGVSASPPSKQARLSRRCWWGRCRRRTFEPQRHKGHKEVFFVTFVSLW